MVEDLLHDERYDVAVVTFTPRRGMGLSRLLVGACDPACTTSVVMLLDDDGTMDWAYLARGAAVSGLRRRACGSSRRRRRVRRSVGALSC